MLPAQTTPQTHVEPQIRILKSRRLRVMLVYPLAQSEAGVLVDPLSCPLQNHEDHGHPHHAQRTHHDAHQPQAIPDRNPPALPLPTLHPAGRLAALSSAVSYARPVEALA